MRTLSTVRGDLDGPVVRFAFRECPYCREALEPTPHGGVCRRCGSTVGVDPGRQPKEESQP